MSCPALSVPKRCQPLRIGGWLRHSAERMIHAACGVSWCTSAPPTKRTKRTKAAPMATGCRANRRQVREAKNLRRSGSAAAGAVGAVWVSPVTSVQPRAWIEQGEDDLAEHRGGDHDPGGKQQRELQLIGVDGSDTVGIQLEQADEQLPDPSELEDPVDRERRPEESPEVGDDRGHEGDESVPQAVAN